MIFQSTVKFIPALLYSIVFLGLFYWQFISVYDFIINHYTESKLFILYGYLFIYLFGVQIVAISLINLLHKHLIKDKIFVTITILTLLVFYAIAFGKFYHVIEYFVDFPLDSNAIMGMILFVVFSFGYSLYSLGILFFKNSIPLGHILIFFILGLLYSSGFIHYYCMPLF